MTHGQNFCQSVILSRCLRYLARHHAFPKPLRASNGQLGIKYMKRLRSCFGKSGRAIICLGTVLAIVAISATVWLVSLDQAKAGCNLPGVGNVEIATFTVTEVDDTSNFETVSTLVNNDNPGVLYICQTGTSVNIRLDVVTDPAGEEDWIGWRVEDPDDNLVAASGAGSASPPESRFGGPPPSCSTNVTTLTPSDALREFHVKLFCDKEEPYCTKYEEPYLTDPDPSIEVIEIIVYIINVDLTAYRPYTEGPGYGNPFVQRAVPDDEEESPGAGIRINGDTDSAADENDLIEVAFEVNPFPIPSGLTYLLKRNSSSIKVWDSKDMSGSVLLDSAEEEITISSSPMSVWVENPSGGDADLELVARSGSTDFCSDKVRFYAFDSVIVILSGESSPPDHLSSGLFLTLSQHFYTNGYDVHYYNEDEAMDDGWIANDRPIVEINQAASVRGVSSVAVIGYSHGGGTAHDMAPYVTPTIDVMVYLDAVGQDFPYFAAEVDRPGGVDYLLNIYQQNMGTLSDLGGDAMGAAADENINTDIPGSSFTFGLSHTQMDDDAKNLDYIYKEVTDRITL
jgi:hypothetical protein